MVQISCKSVYIFPCIASASCLVYDKLYRFFAYNLFSGFELHQWNLVWFYGIRSSIIEWEKIRARFSLLISLTIQGNDILLAKLSLLSISNLPNQLWPSNSTYSITLTCMNYIYPYPGQIPQEKRNFFPSIYSNR